MENNNDTIDLFKRLKKIRNEKGIRIESISENSRIQLKYLQALEDGDLLSIPEVYDKLFFRSYLKSLSIENEETLFEEFLVIRNKIRVDKTTTMIHISEPSNDATGNIFSHRNLFVILPVVLIIVVLAILLYNTEMIGTSSNGKVQEIDIKNVVQRIEAREQAKLDSVKRVNTATADSVKIANSDSSRLLLTVYARRKTWFRMIVDKSDTSEYLLNPGQIIKRPAYRTFEFLIGRADGLKFNLGGKELASLGTDSTVVRYLRIDSTGIAIKILKTENSEKVNNALL